ncbi:MAG: hypothetical protein ACOC45_03420 [Alkalispirochaetaceae bacterium]
MRFEEVRSLTLEGREIATLYRILKPRELELHGDEQRLLHKVERALYEGLSIEDMERLEEEIRTNS